MVSAEQESHALLLFLKKKIYLSELVIIAQFYSYFISIAF